MEKITISIGEALQMKKRYSQELAEAVTFRSDNAWITSPDAVYPGKSVNDMTNEIQDIVLKYNKISEMIMILNSTTELKFEGINMTLVLAILTLDTLRKEITSLTKILKDPNTRPNMYNRRTKDDIEYFTNFNRDNILEQLANLKDSRDKLIRELTKTNWKTSLTIEL